ncbi:hypothetical protein FEM03_23575 [Phragmitibacter flavus]|uniref:Core-binding (CB) domain-containing protein n=1 Tax=Phragmitibacter flavus TaxID=2576071 RepID=A0A5R8K7H7_9BACT|nr:phage integrase N-terminal SAM-like domain-containing protein [Phragmitibacter flavus]TLD68300.1 hypothetical protein FEM03_23575 [Phragmitibacter flavus]
MGRHKQRTRTTAPKTSSNGITIQEIQRFSGDGSSYLTYRVQGWRQDGKWKRRQFKKRRDAETFAASKRVEMENKGTAQMLVLSPLTEEQHRQAANAFERLAGTYTLEQAISYFLENHRPPEHTISLRDAVGFYLDDCERSGIRPRTLFQKRSVLNQFTNAVDNDKVHSISPAKIQAFLKSLQAKNGAGPATRKTWNNYRNDLNHFFAWAREPDLASNRPYTFTNPVEKVRVFTAKQVAEQREPIPATTAPTRVVRIFSALMRWKGGRMVRHYALLYFAGIRPAELERMAGREGELINLKTGVITIPASVSKTGDQRQVTISPSLVEWLKVFTGDVMPPNQGRVGKLVRKHFAITHDEPRHSFISYHVAKNRSIGDAALQAGNSESIVKQHYLNTHTQAEGVEFFAIVPDLQTRRAIISKPLSNADQRVSYLKAV